MITIIRNRTSRFSGAVAVLLAASFATGCGGGETTARDGPAVTVVSAQRTSTAVTGGTEAEQRLLRSVLERVGGASIVAAELGRAPGCPDDCFVASDPDARWVYFTLNVPDRSRSVRAHWEALLVVGAYRDEATAVGIRPVEGKTIVTAYPAGEPDRQDSVLARPHSAAVSAVPSDNLVRLIAAGARDSGAALDSVAFLQPKQLAPIIVVTTPDSHGFISERSVRLHEIHGRIIDSEQPLVDGSYIEVRDRDGALVTASGYSVRTGEGVGWIRPDLDSVARELHPD